MLVVGEVGITVQYFILLHPVVDISQTIEALDAMKAVLYMSKSICDRVVKYNSGAEL